MRGVEDQKNQPVRGEGPQGKLKHCDGSEVNAMAEKTSVKASLPSLHDKQYPSLELYIPLAILEESKFVIAIINVTFYYSATPASVYASSAWGAVCIIRGILALYSENAAEMISEGLKSKNFLGGILATRAFMHCWKPPPPYEFLPTPLGTCKCK